LLRTPNYLISVMRKQIRDTLDFMARMTFTKKCSLIRFEWRHIDVLYKLSVSSKLFWMLEQEQVSWPSRPPELEPAMFMLSKLQIFIVQQNPPVRRLNMLVRKSRSTMPKSRIWKT
jgi:hypothetical protein